MPQRRNAQGKVIVFNYSLDSRKRCSVVKKFDKYTGILFTASFQTLERSVNQCLPVQGVSVRYFAVSNETPENVI